MTEKQIQLLGFEINYDDGAGDWDKYHYYTYTVAKGLEFITNASDEVKPYSANWYVEIFNTEPAIRFTKFEEVQALINSLSNKLVK